MSSRSSSHAVTSPTVTPGSTRTLLPSAASPKIARRSRIGMLDERLLSEFRTECESKTLRSVRNSRCGPPAPPSRSAAASATAAATRATLSPCLAAEGRKSQRVRVR